VSHLYQNVDVDVPVIRNGLEKVLQIILASLFNVGQKIYGSPFCSVCILHSFVTIGAHDYDASRIARISRSRSTNREKSSMSLFGASLLTKIAPRRSTAVRRPP
jgi:hypothetical protein